MLLTALVAQGRQRRKTFSSGHLHPLPQPPRIPPALIYICVLGRPLLRTFRCCALRAPCTFRIYACVHRWHFQEITGTIINTSKTTAGHTDTLQCKIALQIYSCQPRRVQISPAVFGHWRSNSICQLYHHPRAVTMGCAEKSAADIYGPRVFLIVNTSSHQAIHFPVFMTIQRPLRHFTGLVTQLPCISFKDQPSSAAAAAVR